MKNNFEEGVRCLIIKLPNNSNLSLLKRKALLMSNELKLAYIKKIQERYQKSKKVEKGVILDELCKTFPQHRKTAIRGVNRKKAEP